MRHLDPGDVARMVAKINRSKRGRKYRRNARRKLLKDTGASIAPYSGNLHLSGGGVVCAKRRYVTEAEADEALTLTKQSPNPKRRETRVYNCPWCKGFHLTHKSEKDDGDQKAHRHHKRHWNTDHARPQGGHKGHH